MSLDVFKNFALATVSTGYDNTATSIVLTTGHGAKLPAAPFNAIWWNTTDYASADQDPNAEIVRVTARSTDTCTITRAQEGTTASVKNIAGKTYKFLSTVTARSINAFPMTFISGIGTTTSATSMTSLLPGATALSIPGGFLQSGDLVIVRALYGHVGGSTAFNSDCTLNQFFGGWGGTQESGSGYLAELFLAVRDSGHQTVATRMFNGGNFGAPRYQNTFNLANPLTIDIGAFFTAAPAGGELISLDHYSVTIQRNAA